MCSASSLFSNLMQFASVIGEILADLAIDGKTAHNIDFFRLEFEGRPVKFN